MLQNLSGWHALVILAIVLLVFGSSKLPQLAKGLGQSLRILKDEMHDDRTHSTERITEPTSVTEDPVVRATASADPGASLRAS